MKLKLNILRKTIFEIENNETIRNLNLKVMGQRFIRL